MIKVGDVVKFKKTERLSSYKSLYRVQEIESFPDSVFIKQIDKNSNSGFIFLKFLSTELEAYKISTIKRETEAGQKFYPRRFEKVFLPCKHRR